MGDKNTTAEVIGKNLRKYRALHNMTPKSFSELLEIDEQYYGQAERGKKMFKLEKLIQICGKLGITLNELYPMET